MRGTNNVATREGGVDRNNSFQLTRSTKKVATREGGVDRNDMHNGDKIVVTRSPPARVAWIETLL